jgi:hypothetical protein
MSSKGNRSQPNETRISGHTDRKNAQANPNIGGQGGATHQESRDHNKHNDPGQSGHKPQQPKPSQEKH